MLGYDPNALVRAPIFHTIRVLGTRARSSSLPSLLGTASQIVSQSHKLACPTKRAAPNMHTSSSAPTPLPRAERQEEDLSLPDNCLVSIRPNLILFCPCVDKSLLSLLVVKLQFFLWNSHESEPSSLLPGGAFATSLFQDLQLWAGDPLL